LQKKLLQEKESLDAKLKQFNDNLAVIEANVQNKVVEIVNLTAQRDKAQRMYEELKERQAKNKK